MLSFTQLINASKKVTEKGLVYQLDESWMQGRAIFGGLSAALCVDGANKLIANMPPLRSASFNFIGIASDEVWIQAKVLRQGKSVTYVSSQLLGAQGIVCDAVLCFGAARESTLNKSYGKALYGDKSNVIQPDETISFADQIPKGAKKPESPLFTRQFDTRVVSCDLPFSGSIDASHELWIRHRDQKATGLVALIALADMPPPAVLSALTKPAPVSSMTWMINILTDQINDNDHWFLFGSFAESAKGGYSSQNMTVHNQSGELVIAGRQNIAVFS